MANEVFDEYLMATRTIADIDSASALLSWDQETYMPDGATEARAEQLSTLSAMTHQMTTSPEYGERLEFLRKRGEEGELEEWQRAAVRESRRSYDRAVKLPEEHVRALTRATSLGQHAWKEARTKQDFSIFLDILGRLVALKRRETEYLGFAENPYDALIDLYEPGATVATLRPVFERLQQGTRELLDVVQQSGVSVDDSILYAGYDPDRQLKFARETIGHLGFDLNTGRVDLSAHPFCTTFAISDVRLTTRILPDDLRSCLFGLIHEAGHGMYEQGIDPRFMRTSLATGTSMGIHESQSLLWENMVARSEAFWDWSFPRLRDAFPERLSTVEPFDFYRAINVVKPSMIRIEADELTYNLHIVLRFEIEEALINGTIDVADVPKVWNQKMEEYLGIVPANDAEGCLQDVHWSFGGFGYFPSYTLGKLYAAMFYEQAGKDLPGLNESIAQGDFSALLEWLRQSVHRWGKQKGSAEIAQSICGTTLTAVPFLDYNRRKINRIYK
jgi:carboxypeptidase Taq